MKDRKFLTDGTHTTVEKHNPVAEVRPAIRDDLKTFYGKDSIGPTVKAFAGIVDGEIVAVGGLAFCGGMVIAFLDLKPEARRFKYRLHRTAKRFVAEAKQQHRVIFAGADESEASAQRWLTALGFEHHEGRIYRWLR